MKSIVVLVVLVFVGIITYNVLWFTSSEEITITVTDKEKIVESNGDNGVTSKYLVFTENEVFENTDVLLLGKWNSSDIQGRLRKDSTYTVKVYGWRIPFFSTYRNITKINK